MRWFLCGALLAFAGCGGGPTDALLGTYAVAGFGNVLTVDGKTTTTSLTPLAGTKLVITRYAERDESTATWVVISLGGIEVTKAAWIYSSSRIETLSRNDETSDSDCVYRTSWSQGGPITLDGSVLSMKRTGSVSADCTSAGSFFGTGEQNLQATKD